MRCICPPLARCSFILLILVLTRLVTGGSVNRTIDDVRGDSATGALVQYLPQVPAGSKSLWFNQTSCAGCADVPDASQTFDGTWSAALYQANVGSLSVTMKFTGTHIYVFFVVPNFLANSGLASTVSCQFFIDSVAVGTFEHQSDGSGAFEYNSLVYQNVTLPDEDHVLLIETSGADAAIIIFDYAIYTFDTPDASPPPVASLPVSHANVASSTNTPPLPPPPTSPSSPEMGTSSATATFSSTQFASAPAFPTAALPASDGSVPPPFETGATSAVAQPFSTTPPSLAPAPGTDTETIQPSVPVVAIVGAVVGAVMLLGLIFVAYLVYRRRRQQQDRAASGTISVFDLLDHAPPPDPPPRRPHRPRALPTPPMSERGSGRSIDATPTKTNMQAPVPGPSGYHHSAQSSMSGYSDARSDLHIHIPMSSLQGQSYSPSPLTVGSSHTPSHSHSYSHGHSPITRNGVPMLPDQAEIVRELLGSLAVDHGSEHSGSFTPTTEMDDDEDWSRPVVHVDSGVRFSRTMMELPPVYAAS